MRRVLLAGASLAVLLASANVKAAELVVSTDTPLSENVTFGTGQTYDSFSNKDNALYGFDATDTGNYNITFGAGTTSVNLTGNGSKASGIAANGKLSIEAGTFNVSNTGSDVYDNTTQLAGYRGVTVTGGEINLGKGTAMFSGLAGDTTSNMTASNVDLNGGTVNLDGGIILTSSNESSSGEINIAGATVNANSGRLVSKTTNVNSGTLNINGAVDLYGNKANDATGATLNVSGGSFNLNDADLNAGKVTVNITGGTNTVTGSNTVTGDVTINTAGNLTLTKGSSLEFGAGTLTIDGTHGASGSAQRNGIAGIVENDAPLGEVTLNGTTVNITGGGNIEVDKLNITGGDINVSGTGTNLSVPAGEEWRKGSIISGTTSLNMTGGKVTLGENGQMITYENGSINLSGGEVVLNGGSGTEAILRASNGIDNPTSKINIDGAKVTVSGYGIIDSVDTTLSSGSLEIASGGNLALVTNMGEAKTADGSSTRADAIPGVLKVTGGSVSNAGAVTGTVDLSEGSYAGEANSTLETLNQSGGTAENSGTITTAELTGGTFDNKNGATVTTANLGGTTFTNSGTVATANLSSGTFNAEAGSTVTTLAMTGGNYNLNGNSTITNASTVDGGTLNLGTNTLTTAGLTVSNQAVINTTVANTADGNGLVNGNISGTLTVKEDPSGKATMNLVVANGTDLSKGSITVNKDAEIADNMMYDFTKTAEGVYTATKADTAAKVSQYGATGNEAAVLAAFSGMAADGKSTGSSVGDAIANAMAQDLQKANGSGVANAAAQADQMIPMAASVAVNVSTENATQILNAVDNELTGFNLSQGRSSGDTFRRVNAWIKGLFNRADYEKTSNHKGYKADNDGLVAGIDGMVSDTVKLGAGYSFISSDIKSGGKKTTADTHTAILYGQYKPSDLYFNAIGTYGWGKYKSKASAYGYGLGGKYDVNTIGAQLMAGYDMGFFAPEAGFRYFNVKQKKHTDNAGQTIGKNSNDVLTAVVGVKYQGTYCLNSNWSLKPNARLAVTYDLMSDKENSVVSLANGSGYVVDGQRLKRLGLEVGAGIAADLNENLEIGLSYEGKFRDNYTDNTGLIEARYKF